MSSSGRRIPVRLVHSLVLTLLSCGLAFGQSFTASVRGTAKDPSGASVPRASVTITDADRGTNQTTLADEAGRFVITALPPGQYVLTVEATGFKKFSSGRFTLVVQQQATVDARLEVGEVSETVEVRGSAALVNTTIANLGQVIDNQTIVSLPNLGRNPMAFTYLTPGVVGSGGRPGDSNTNFVANGSRNSTSDVLLDGVTVVTVEQNSGITDLKYSPALDAVQEFKVQTNFFSAEFGQTGGAVVNMVTKSGTNDFNGTAYYFLRHSDLNANNWFSNKAGRAIPYYRRDQIGGVFGGPLIKNKTFFFVTYQYTKSKNPITSTRTVPTLLQRQGDFSQTRNAAGQVMTIYNPFDTFINAAGNLERRPFPGNVIPRSMLDPIALRALSYFPLPNQAGTPITETNNWFGQGTLQDVGRQMNVKLDHNFSARSRLSARYSYGPYTQKPPNLFGEQAPAFPLNFGPVVGSAHSVVAEFTRTQSPTALWSLRYGLTYAAYTRDPLESFDLTELAMADNGAAVVAWQAQPVGVARGVRASRWTEQDGWEVPAELDRDEANPHPAVAVAADGRAFVVWAAGPPGLIPAGLRIASASSAGSWSAPQAVPGAGRDVFQRVSVDAAGTPIVAWADGAENLDRGGEDGVWHTRLGASGWSAPVRHGSSPCCCLELAGGRPGEAVLSWRGGGRVQVSRVQEGGAPVVQLLAGPDGCPTLRVDGRGNAIVTWTTAETQGAFVSWAALGTPDGRWTDSRRLGGPADRVSAASAALRDGTGILTWVEMIGTAVTIHAQRLRFPD